jgi:nucleoside-diphosphate-sugar epimerase
MDFSVRELAEMLLDLVSKYPGYKDIKKRIKLEDVSSAEYYGAAYQDVTHRVPSIKEAEKHLGWKPKTDLKTALKLTLDYHLLHKDYELNKMQTR